MRRTVSFWLILALLWLPLSAFGEDVLPEVGQRVHGFAIKSQGTIDLIGANTVLFEHEKSGAQLLYIQNEDTNRAFDITFKTPALDNTGAPHVFEHITISGSDKYPAPNLLFTMMNKTYNTYVNAYTSQTYTTYPLASLSEDQLMTMMDVYLNGVFHPMLYDEPRLVQREAWRYEMADGQSPVTLSGTVYSEMRGVYTLARQARRNLTATLFPGSILANEPGGTPEDIPNLTYEQLLAFHQAYYHPSNALIVLYGKLDYQRFLEAIDRDFLSQYDRKDVAVEMGIVEPVTGLQQASFTYPVEQSSPKDHAGMVHYGFALNDLRADDGFGLVMLKTLLNHESSPLMAAVREQIPGATLAVSFDMLSPMPVLQFELSNANASDAETLKTLVDEQLASLVQNGFDMELVKALVAQERFDVLTMGEQANAGVNIAMALGYVFSTDSDLNYFNNYTDMLLKLEELSTQRYFEGLIEQYLSQSNTHRALVTTEPAPGEAEVRDAQLAETLQAYRDSLSEEQVQSLVEQSAAFVAWSTEEAPEAVAQSMQVVSAQDLPEQVQSFAVQDREVGGVRRMSTPVDVEQIVKTQLMLSSDFVALEDLPYLTLYANLLGTLPTEQYSRDQVAQKLSQQISGFGAAPTATVLTGKDQALYRFAVDWTGFTNDYQENLDLIDEVLFKTDVTQVEDLVSFVQRERLTVQQAINNSGFTYQVTRSLAKHHAMAAYAMFSGGLNYYAFLGQVEAQLKTDPQAVIEKLRFIQSGLNNRGGALAMVAANEADLGACDALLDDYLAGKSSMVYEPADYSDMPMPADREAMVTDSAMQYNVLAATPEQLGLQADGRYEVVGKLLGDMYLVPVLRNQMGVYTPIVNLLKDQFIFLAYRDPNIAETYKVLEGMGEFLRTLTLDQAAIDPYILSVYSGYALPKGPLTGAFTAMGDLVRGETEQTRLAYMQQIKSLTADDLAAFADALDRFVKEGMRSTSGSNSAIQAAADQFDDILTPVADAEATAE